VFKVHVMLERPGASGADLDREDHNHGVTRRRDGTRRCAGPPHNAQQPSARTVLNRPGFIGTWFPGSGCHRV